MNKEASKSKELFLNLGIALVAYVLSIILGRLITIPVSGYAGNARGRLSSNNNDESLIKGFFNKISIIKLYNWL